MVPQPTQERFLRMRRTPFSAPDSIPAKCDGRRTGWSRYIANAAAIPGADNASATHSHGHVSATGNGRKQTTSREAHPISTQTDNASITYTASTMGKNAFHREEEAASREVRALMSYPFIPEVAMPSMNCFCPSRNTMRIGSTDSTEPVMIIA